MSEYSKIVRTEKELMKISKVVYTEQFFHGMLEMAGSQKAQMLEKLTKNPGYMKSQDVVMKVFVAIFQILLVIVPVSVFMNFQSAYTQNDHYQLLFALSSTISILTVFQIFYILIFGINTLTGMFGVDTYAYLETLPLSRKDLENISYQTLVHGFRYQLLAIFFTLPLATLILSFLKSEFFLLPLVASVIRSIIVVQLSIWLTVRTSAYFAQKFSKYAVNSRKNTIIRILFTLVYAIGSFMIYLVFQLAFSVLVQMVNQAILPENLRIPLTYLFSAIPIIFSDSYLYCMLFFQFTDFPIAIYILSIIGTILGVLIAIKLWKSTKNIVFTIGVKKQGMRAEGREEISDITQLNVEINTPINAFIKRDLTAISRDLQLMMFVVMAFILPAFGLIVNSSAASSAEIPIEELFFPTYLIISLYSMITSLMVFGGLTQIEDDGNAIGMSLPIVIREQALGRVKLALYILLLAPIPTALYLIITQDLVLYFFALLNLLAIPLFFVFFSIITFSLSFGKVNKRYTLNMVNIEHKILKYVGIFVLTFVIYGLDTAGFVYFGELYGIFAGLIISLLLKLLGAVFLLLIFAKMFPGRKIYEKSISMQ